MVDFIDKLNTLNVLFLTFGATLILWFLHRYILPFVKILNSAYKKSVADKTSFKDSLLSLKKESLLKSRKKLSLKSLSDEMMADDEFLLEFLIKNPGNLQDLDKSYLTNKDFCLSLIGKIPPIYIKELPNEFTKDKDFILRALKLAAYYMEEVDNSLRGDKEIALLAVTRMAANYAILPQNLRYDPEIISAAINNYPLFFVALDDSIKDQEEYLLEALIGLSKTNDKYMAEHTKEILQSASARIQAICDESNPIKSLKAFILSKNLSSSLLNKAVDAPRKVNKL